MARRLLVHTALGLSVAGCGWSSSSSGHSGSCPSGQRCDSSKPAGVVHGQRADGTVDITLEQAWPDRSLEPTPLSALELAQACVALSACQEVEPPDAGTIEGVRRIILSLCAQPAPDSPAGSGPGTYFWEERAVPLMDENERWTFKAREMIARAGNCTDVLAVATARTKEIHCEEAGCWWTSPSLPIPTVTCNGDVATLVTSGRSFDRDCARSFTRCDETSPTGCSDRAPVACASPAEDRCDGAFRIGCDGSGRVSLRDCSRAPGATCGGTPGNLGCIYPDAGECAPGAGVCEGASLRLCVFGSSQLVDCTALGLGACANGLCPAI